MNLELTDRVVLISGAAAGIGAATARAFAAEGARVVLVDRDETAGQALAAELSGSLFLHADLTDELASQQVVAETVAAFGRLDVLVNNAGFNDSVSLAAPPADFLTSLRRNLLHVYALTHFARPNLLASKGAIVNVSSKVAVTGQGQTSGYAAAKGAINALTREWALAFAADGVRVNAVVPAECDTAQYQRWVATQSDPAAGRAAVARLIPLEQRLTTPAEIADAIVWLASPRAGHITGQLLFVDGGYTHLDRAASHEHPKWG